MNTGTNSKECNDNAPEGVSADTKSMNDWINTITNVCKAAASGDLESRILNIETDHEMAPMMNAINDTLDLADAYVRESSTALAYAGGSKFYRKVLPVGLVGTYRASALTTNDTISTMDQNARDLENTRREIAEAQVRARQEANEKLQEGIGSITGQLDQGAQQIAHASQSLATGATEQAASLEEINASLEEMASTTRNNAENTQLASRLANESRSATEHGQKQMFTMSEAMDQISDSSTEISKIIKVIDEIAFQTNLLALNAAVEAARAGEAGKGFAVVADEVRNLAQRSAEAAKNTASMIEESNSRALSGVTICKSVVEALDEIGESARKTDELLSEITAVSKDQAAGIEQINSGVTELDKVTQQNAANAEEMAASAQETAAQVTSLNETVKKFTARDNSDSEFSLTA